MAFYVISDSINVFLCIPSMYIFQIMSVAKIELVSLSCVAITYYYRNVC